MKFSTAILFAIALICGVAVGYMFNPSVDEPVQEPKHEKPKGSVRDEGDAATIKALRAKIVELEAKLAKGERKPADEDDAVKHGEDRREGARRDHKPMSPKEWREKMKKDNPEQYAKMTNHMARMRRERLERAQKKVDFLSSIDTSRMSASTRKTHDELKDLIAKREEMDQKMHVAMESDEEISDEDRRAFFDEMRQTDDRIRELNAKERDNLMVETVKNLGFSEEESGEVAEAFQEIIENTEGGWNPTGRPPRGGNPPPQH